MNSVESFARRRSAALTVRHFGPDVGTVGGIATVIRVLCHNRVGCDEASPHSTWHPDSHTNTLRDFVAALNTMSRLHREVVVHVHLSERGSFVREGMLVVYAARRNMGTVATIHGASFLPFASRHPTLVRSVLAHARVVTCLDPEVLEVVRLAAPASRVELVPNPIAIEPDVAPADDTEELVLFAGEIGTRKGADVLEQAWRLVARERPRARCVLVGPAADYVPAEGDRLHVREPVDPSGIRELLTQARVVALPARAEGMPMILTEAMSMGRPFVSTPVGGIPDLARFGGVLVPVGDHETLARELISLLSDPQAARDLGDAGREFCIRTRSVQTVDRRFRDLYEASRSA